MGSFLFHQAERKCYMKKRVIRKKKTNVQFVNKKGRINILQRVAVLGMAVMLFSSAITARAEESVISQTQFYVYHEHKGSEEKGGGCYSVPVCHVHQGNEAEGGNCYQTPVYHVHEGDEQNGGACYGRAVYHEHDGNSKKGGLCYKVVYHSHSEECYVMIPSGDLGCTVLRIDETEYDDYVDHDFKDYHMSCGKTVHGTNPAHYHKELDCDREGKIDSFKLSCKMTSSTIERYEMDCPKTEETIDSYTLSCPKTEKDIDKYEMGCGRDMTTPLGRITVTGKLTSSKQKAEITAVYEDMSEGEVTIAENAFSWYDESGKLIGSGETLQVIANGKYYVMLNVHNEDVKAGSLKSEVQIKGIQKKKTETKEDTGEDSGKEDSSDDNGSGDDNGGNSGSGEDNGGNSGSSDDTGSSSGSGGNDSGGGGEDGESNRPTSAPKSIVSPSPAPTTTPVAVKTLAPTATVSPDRTGKLLLGGIGSNLSSKNLKKTPSPTPTSVMQKETKNVKLEEKESEKEELIMIESVEKQDESTGESVFATPAMKLITVTTGTLVLMGGIGLLIFLFGRSIRVYNDDGKGNLIYLGRGIVKVEEEGYVLHVTERMTEKSMTNRYCLCCDLFHLWKDTEEELIVVKKERRQIVKIQKEMIAVI